MFETGGRKVFFRAFWQKNFQTTFKDMDLPSALLKSKIISQQSWEMIHKNRRSLISIAVLTMLAQKLLRRRSAIMYHLAPKYILDLATQR